MQLAFVTANYYARAAGYSSEVHNWGELERLTVEHTTLEEFDKMCAEIVGAGFNAIEIWKAHAWPSTLTPERADELLDILQKHKLTPVSYAGGLGSDADEMLRAARLLGIQIIAGGVSKESAHDVARMARKQVLRIAIENHPEKTPAEIIDKIGHDDDVLGACIDTGWWLIQGYDPAKAIRELGRHVFHIHLKDMAAMGSHESVQLGKGVMDVADVLAAIKEIGYTGPISIEHEPPQRDPTDDVRAGRELVERLWGA